MWVCALYSTHCTGCVYHIEGSACLWECVHYTLHVVQRVSTTESVQHRMYTAQYILYGTYYVLQREYYWIVCTLRNTLCMGFMIYVLQREYYWIVCTLHNTLCMGFIYYSENTIEPCERCTAHCVWLCVLQRVQHSVYTVQHVLHLGCSTQCVYTAHCELYNEMRITQCVLNNRVCITQGIIHIVHCAARDAMGVLHNTMSHTLYYVIPPNSTSTTKQYKHHQTVQALPNSTSTTK